MSVKQTLREGITPTALPLPVPSMEDELSAAVDSERHANDADNLEEEVTSLVGRHDIAQDYVKRYSGEIHIDPEEITQEELTFIDYMVKGLAEGTGYNRGSVMPSIESEGPGKPSLESIRNLMDTFFSGIKKLLESLWEAILNYWELFGTRVGGLVRSARMVKDRANEVVGKPRGKGKITLTRTRYFTHFYNKGKYPTDFTTLHNAYKSLGGLAHDLTARWGKDVIEAGNKSMEILSNIGVSEVEPDLAKLNRIAGDLWGKLDNSLKTTQPIMGSAQLVYDTEWAGVVQSEQPVETARLIQGTTLTLESQLPDVDIDKLVFKTMSAEEIDQLMDEIISVGEQMHQYLRDNHLTRLGSKSKEFVRRAQQNIGRGDDALEESNYRHRLDITFRYAIKYAQWVKNPIIPLTRLVVEISRSIQMLSNECLDQYQ